MTINRITHRIAFGEWRADSRAIAAHNIVHHGHSGREDALVTIAYLPRQKAFGRIEGLAGSHTSEEGNMTHRAYRIHPPTPSCHEALCLHFKTTHLKEELCSKLVPQLQGRRKAKGLFQGDFHRLILCRGGKTQRLGWKEGGFILWRSRDEVQQRYEP